MNRILAGNFLADQAERVIGILQRHFMSRQSRRGLGPGGDDAQGAPDVVGLVAAHADHRDATAGDFVNFELHGLIGRAAGQYDRAAATNQIDGR